MPTDLDDDEQDHERLMGIVKAHVAQLAEHFENIQVFVSKHLNDDAGTTVCNYGSGNWHARYGQVREWCVKQDERSRIEVRKES